MLQTEIKHRLAHGCTQLTLKELTDQLHALGYELVRDEDCKHNAVYVSGPEAGRSYPAISTGIREIDTQQSAYHYDSRRDAKYRKMQALRWDTFTVTDGRLLEF